MATVKTIHVGGIRDPEGNVKTFTRSSRTKVIAELNTWWFDYFRANYLEIRQLPPLDDWTHSKEDNSYWSVTFPETGWLVWIQHEPVEFS